MYNMKLLLVKRKHKEALEGLEGRGRWIRGSSRYLISKVSGAAAQKRGQPLSLDERVTMERRGRGKLPLFGEQHYFWRRMRIERVKSELKR
ncbi:hypothetical protein VNO77_43536 [Canavalia gladiata]|uniref:Uncharacterized protein n=1 Tax=Canavalia gladiata TaxID=3824 RepID=A0AAN9PPI6_CANGL